jgi:hypothetical protein
MTGEMPDSVLAFAKGDPVAAEQLRRSLEILRDRVGDPRVTAQIGRVLDGRTSVRELVRDPAFAGVLARGMGSFGRRYEEMSPEERLAMNREARRQDEVLRAELGLPPSPPEPEAEVEFRPQEPPRRP